MANLDTLSDDELDARLARRLNQAVQADAVVRAGFDLLEMFRRQSEDGDDASTLLFVACRDALVKPLYDRALTGRAFLELDAERERRLSEASI